MKLRTFLTSAVAAAATLLAPLGWAYAAATARRGAFCR